MRPPPLSASAFRPGPARAGARARALKLGPAWIQSATLRPCETLPLQTRPRQSSGGVAPPLHAEPRNVPCAPGV